MLAAGDSGDRRMGSCACAAGQPDNAAWKIHRRPRAGSSRFRARKSGRSCFGGPARTLSSRGRASCTRGCWATRGSTRPARLDRATRVGRAGLRARTRPSRQGLWAERGRGSGRRRSCWPSSWSVDWSRRASRFCCRGSVPELPFFRLREARPALRGSLSGEWHPGSDRARRRAERLSLGGRGQARRVLPERVGDGEQFDPQRSIVITIG